MLDNKTFTQLKNAMNDFAYIHFFKYNDMGAAKEAVGLFCSASVFIKKDAAMERTKKILKEMNFPYTVSEKGIENTKHFEIFF